MRKPTWLSYREGCHHWGSRATSAPKGSAGVLATACRHRETDATRETPAVVGRAHQLEIREDQAGPSGVAGGPLYR
jgi:hypothetical protein